MNKADLSIHSALGESRLEVNTAYNYEKSYGGLSRSLEILKLSSCPFLCYMGSTNILELGLLIKW